MSQSGLLGLKPAADMQNVLGEVRMRHATGSQWPWYTQGRMRRLAVDKDRRKHLGLLELHDRPAQKRPGGITTKATYQCCHYGCHSCALTN